MTMSHLNYNVSQTYNLYMSYIESFLREIFSTLLSCTHYLDHLL